MNCLFSGNRADVNGPFRGGAIYLRSTAFLEISNCTFSGNTANGDGGAIWNDSSNAGAIAIRNSVIWGNSPTQIS